MQPVQDLTVEDRVSRTQYQYSWKMRTPRNWLLDAAFRGKLKRCRSARRRERPAESGLQAKLVDRSRYRFAAGHSAAGDRRHAVRRVWTAASLDDVHAAEPISRGPGGGARISEQSGRAEAHLCALHRTAAQVPLSAFTHFEPSTTPLAINHQGQFPGSDALFQSGAGHVAGRRGGCDQASAKQELACRPACRPASRERPQAFQASLANEPLLILAALITVYIVLGVLYESYIHPITIFSTLPSAGVGAILALLLCHTDFSVIALIGIILLIGIVKKNAIMMIDFALEAERKEGKSPREAIYRGVPAAVPADHDDHDGGAARRFAAGAWAPAPARNCAGRWASPSWAG